MTPITPGMIPHLLPPEFEVCIVGYRPVFFLLEFMAQARTYKIRAGKKKVP